MDGAVEVSDLTFEATGYTIGAADPNATFTLTGVQPAVTVPDAESTALLNIKIASSAGFEKLGAGTLELGTNNTYSGITHVREGTLKMANKCPTSLGATGASNKTIVYEGAALDINGAFIARAAETLELKGHGPDGRGALVNRKTGSDYNMGFTGGITLLGDTSIDTANRIDLRTTITGNGHTFTKNGAAEFAIAAAVNNCKIIINAGNYTYMNNNALGGTDFDTTMNGGWIRTYGTYTIKESIIVNGGGFVASGSGTQSMTMSGPVTLNGIASVRGDGAAHTLILSGALSGTGGIQCVAGGNVIITGNNNSYTGSTIIDSSATLYLGVPGKADGVLGYGMVTNSGTLKIDRNGNVALTNSFVGTGSVHIQADADVVMGNCSFTNGSLRIGQGSLTLTNGASIYCSSYLQFADRSIYPTGEGDPSNIVSRLYIRDGAFLEANTLNLGLRSHGSNTGIVEQTGGTVTTFGGRTSDYENEYPGLYMGHYPSSHTTWKMMGGTINVQNGYQLTCAIDGTGVLHQTGGTIYTDELHMNSRSGNTGHGTFILEGGTMNIGSNGITTGKSSPYRIDLGAGTLRATTNFTSTLNANLVGLDDSNVHIDTQEWIIEISGNLTGTGGLAKTGSGTLTLSGKNTYAGPTRILQGRLAITENSVLPEDNLVLVHVTEDDTGGRIHTEGILSLDGFTIGVDNPQELNKKSTYTIATWGIGLLHGFSDSILPAPWYMRVDQANKFMELRADVGTILLLR